MKCATLAARAVAGVVTVALIGVGTAAPASATVSLQQLLGQVSTAAPVSPDLVVKVNVAGGRTITELTSRFAIKVKSPLLASRGIYLVTMTKASDYASTSAVNNLIGLLKKDPAVVYVETNVAAQLTDTRMHGWPQGAPSTATYSAAGFSTQPAATGLAAAQGLTLGTGEVVAVLDTGVDATHPALTGRIKGGWDYVDDDASPTDVPDDPTGSPLYRAYGHGTFVAGMVSLVAPGVTIMPERVLDGDGNGNVFVIAQAILDAVANGADVINLSFGTDGNTRSALLDEALAVAYDKGVMVVVSAGNKDTLLPLYPASSSKVLSVTALDATGKVAPYASYGLCVEVAAPGTGVIGPVPGGGYAAWAGTSMAAPLVSGQVALIRARTPRLTVAQQESAVETTTRRTSGKPILWGAVNVRSSLDKR